MSNMQKLWMRADGSAWGGYASCREGDVGSFAVIRETDHLAAIKAARSQALEEAIAACQAEAVEDTGHESDKGYNMAIKHVSDTIRRLGEEAGKT